MKRKEAVSVLGIILVVAFDTSFPEGHTASQSHEVRLCKHVQMNSVFNVKNLITCQFDL